MKKILFCDNSIQMLVNFRGDVIKYFHAMGYEIVLVYPTSTEKMAIHNEYSFAKFYPLEVEPNAISPLKDLAYMCQLFRIYKEEKPNIIFHYTIKPNIYGTLAATVSLIPSVAMVAGLGSIFKEEGVSQKLGKILYKIGLRLSNKVITLNESNYTFLVKNKYVRSNSAILSKGGEGVNLTHFNYEPKSFKKLHFLMVGRLLYDKGYSQFVEAASIVQKKHPEVSFEILGPLVKNNSHGVPKKVLEDDVRTHHIKYWGVTADVRPYLSKSGTVMVLLSSYPEGLNRSLMEGCAMGCPCITSSIPGCKEVVDDNITGFIVTKHSGTELANKICQFIELSDDSKEKMSQAARKKAVNCFDIEEVIQMYKNIIAELT